jgi:hypothetical protein
VLRREPDSGPPLAEPPRNLCFVLPARRSKLELQRQFFSWRQDASPDTHEQAPEKDGDASKENRPTKPEAYFSYVHRVSRDCVGAVHEEYLRAPVKLNRFRELRPETEAEYQDPDEANDAGGNWKETKKIPERGASVHPPRPLAKQRDGPRHDTVNERDSHQEDDRTQGHSRPSGDCESAGGPHSMSLCAITESSSYERPSVRHKRQLEAAGRKLSPRCTSCTKPDRAGS